MTLAVTLAALLLLAPDRGSAGNAPAVSGSFTFTSEHAMWVAGKTTVSIPARALYLGQDANVVAVGQLAGEHFHLRLAAPGSKRLRQGVYPKAIRNLDPIRPQLDFGGNGRGCSESTGSFEVLDVAYAAHGYLQSLQATFVHYCDGSGPTRGKVELVARTAPVPVVVKVELDRRRVAVDPADGWLDVRGTVTCAKARARSVSIIADVRELRTSDAAVGRGTLDVPRCSSTPTAWLVEAKSMNGIDFTSGSAFVTVRGSALDRAYTEYAYGPVHASDVVSKQVALVAPEAAPSPPEEPAPPAADTSVSLVVGLAIVGAVGWILLIALASVVAWTRFTRRST